MTDESQPGASVEEASAGQGMLMIGSAILVVGWIIFSVLIGEFTYSPIYMGAATLVLLTVLGMGGISVGNGTLKVIGYWIGIAAVFELVSDLRFGFPDGVADNLANLTFYVGALVMLFGARSVD